MCACFADLSECLPPRSVPIVKRYLAYVEEQAIELSAVNQLGILPTNATNVDDIYVNLTTLTFDEAWELVNEQRSSSLQKIVQLSKKADAEKRKGEQILDTGVLLCREKDGKPIRWAMVMGKAGSGKTILCKKVLSDWCTRQSVRFQNYAAVIYLSGKESSRLKESDVARFLNLNHVFSDQADMDTVVKYLSANSEKLLIVFDGGDEVDRNGILGQGHVLSEILRGGLFPRASVVMTSRPCLDTFNLLDLLSIKFGRLFSLAGLKDDQLYQLARRTLADRSSEFMEQLAGQGKEHMKAAAQDTPLYATMIIQVFKEEGFIPTSITHLYTSMANSVVKLYNVFRREQMSAPGNQSVGDGLQNADDASDDISRLALDGLLNRVLLFSESQAKYYCRSLASSKRLGLLSQLLQPGKDASERLFAFQHLSWQEYLAAKELAKSTNFSASLRQALTHIGTGQHMWLFWRFVAGLVPVSLLPELMLQLCTAVQLIPTAHEARTLVYFLLSCIGQQRVLSHICVSLAATTIAKDGKRWYLSDYPADLSDISGLAAAVFSAQDPQTVMLEHCRLKENHLDILRPALRNIGVLSLSRNSLSGNPLCKLVQGIGSSAYLQVLSFKNCKLTQEDGESIQVLIRNCTSLTQLTLANNKLGSAGVITACQGLSERSNLVAFDLDGNNLEGIDGAVLGCSISKAKALHSLGLSRCTLHDQSASALLPQLATNSSLELVSLDKNKLTNAFLPAVVKFFRARMSSNRTVSAANTRLRLALHRNLISSDDVQQILAQLPHTMDSIAVDDKTCSGGHVLHTAELVQDHFHLAKDQADSSLDCVSLHIGDAGAAAVASCLLESTKSSITSICLFENSIGNDGAKALAVAIPEYPALQGLDLSDNKIRLCGASALCDALSACSRGLQYLNLSVNPIFTADESSEHLFAALISTCKSLKFLSLCSTGLADVHFQTFSSKSLSLSTDLVALFISDNEIGDYGVASMANFARRRTLPRFISLSGNSITEVGASCLAEALLAKPKEEQPACIWLGDNAVASSFFESSDADFCVNGEVSTLGMDYNLIHHTFLSNVDEANDWKDKATVIARDRARYLAVDMNNDGFMAMQQCVTERDARGFLSLMKQGLRCLTAGFVRGEDAYFKYLLNLKSQVAKWLFIGNETGELMVELFCSGLVVANELHLIGLEDAGLVQHYVEGLVGVGQHHFQQVQSVMESFVGLCNERGLPELAECVASQKEVLCSFQQVGFV